MKPELDHNVYILGAGFSFDAGLPLVNDFLERMGDCLDSDSLNQRSRMAISKVFEFRLKAAAAAYRAKLNVENIEELFSLASALEGESASEYISTAIAATLDTISRSKRIPEFTITVFGNTVPGVTQTVRNPRRIPLYQLYSEILTGNVTGKDYSTKNSFITFNYDTLLEDGLHGAGIPFTYGIPETFVSYEHEKCTKDGSGVPVYKLHCSVNLIIDRISKNNMKIYDCFDWVKDREEMERVLIVPPTWRKTFAEQLGFIWEGAVRALRHATRVFVLGFSMPPTDTHFKYLLTAGLQDNISLRKFFFVNPGLQDESMGESTRLRENLFAILRPELEDRKIIELLPQKTMEFLLDTKNRQALHRSPSFQVVISPDPFETDYSTRRL